MSPSLPARCALALFLVAVPALATPAEAGDRHEVRRDLTILLQRFPPELGQVLKLDPSLMQNPAYLEPYTELVAFLQGHPEVLRQPQYYLEDVSAPFEDHRAEAGERMTMNILSNLSALTVFAVVTGVLAWLVKTFVAQRRWAQVVRVQTEAHNKLLDRFAGSEELLAYVQSPSGRRFLEAAPILVEDAPSPRRTPIGRIVGSVQVGLVLAAAGIGLRLVAAQLGGQGAVAISSIGTFVVTIGVGFVVSAAVAFFLSRRLGLWVPAGEPEARA